MLEKQIRKSQRVTCENNEKLTAIKAIITESINPFFPVICDVDVQEYNNEIGDQIIVLFYLNRKMLLDGSFSRKDYMKLMDDTTQKIFSEMGIVVSINTLNGRC